jgi:hypothetical protein
MTGPDAETALRDALSTHTRDITPDTDFVTAAIDHSVASLRATRRRQLLIGVGAALVVVALVAWQAPPVDRRGSTPPTTHSDGLLIVDAFAWAQSLPRGAEADAAYIEWHTLVNGTERVDLGRSARGWLVGPLPGGWLAALANQDVSPGEGPRYGYLRPDGSFLPYEYQPPSDGPATRVGGEAVSPDGSMVAYGGAVVETGLPRSPGGFVQADVGHKVASLPAGAAVVFDWTSAGLVYRDMHGRYWLWSPGAESVRLPYDDVVPTGFGYTRDGDCFDISRISATADAATYQICGKGEPLTVSTGRRALMSDGELVNLEAGVDFLTLPVGVMPEQLQLFWESDDSILVVVHESVPLNPMTVLVRCEVTAGLCERASDPLAHYALVNSPASPSR